jgi:hypothetical protein
MVASKIDVHKVTVIFCNGAKNDCYVTNNEYLTALIGWIGMTPLRSHRVFTVTTGSRDRRLALFDELAVDHAAPLVALLTSTIHFLAMSIGY